MKNNYYLALKRYKNLRRSLDKNKDLEKMYANAMQTLITNQEVVKVNKKIDEATDPQRHINYIPHLAVMRMEKTSTKCRPVFDASARGPKGLSLNSNLLSGPKTQPNLQFLMTHLRTNPILIFADISRMYYKIKYLDCTSEEDKQKLMVDDLRDLYRFLWHADSCKDPDIYKFISVLMGGRDSPYVANATIRHHLDKIIAESEDEEEVKAAYARRAKRV